MFGLAKPLEKQLEPIESPLMKSERLAAQTTLSFGLEGDRWESEVLAFLPILKEYIHKLNIAGKKAEGSAKLNALKAAAQEAELGIRRADDKFEQRWAECYEPWTNRYIARCAVHKVSGFG